MNEVTHNYQCRTHFIFAVDNFDVYICFGIIMY